MTDRCKRCHRIIKNPSSVIHGYGPVCWTKVPHTLVIEQETEQNENIYVKEHHNSNNTEDMQ